MRRPTWDDLPAVLELAQAADIAVIGESDWLEDDLRAEWGELELDRDAWLVELEGRLAGYATFEAKGPRLLADGYVQPELRGRGVGTELLRLTEERARAEVDAIGAGERVYLQNATLLEDESSCTPRLYAANGYVAVRHFWRMVIDLEEEPVAVAAPTGVAIGPYDAREARAVHAAHQEAFADHWEHRRQPWEEWEEKRLGDPRADTSLWLVARDGAEVAGVALNYWKHSGDWGWVGALGVRRAWRGRGLGEALLRSSFRELWRRGERRVALGVDAQSPTGATRLYERVGMRVFWRAVVYEKELRPGG
ncbi:MAG TPA: GNAT family N-acetyltransferase [Gaiellaceae bacterium]